MRNSLWATLHSSKQPCMLAKAHISGFEQAACSGQAFCCAGWVQKAPDLAPYPAPERQSTFWVRPFVLAAADGSRLRQDFLKCQTPGSRSVMKYVCRLHSSYPKNLFPFHILCGALCHKSFSNLLSLRPTTPREVGLFLWSRSPKPIAKQWLTGLKKALGAVPGLLTHCSILSLGEETFVMP